MFSVRRKSILVLGAVAVLAGCAERSGFEQTHTKPTPSFWLKASISNVEVTDGNTLLVTATDGGQVSGTGELELHGIRFDDIKESQSAGLRLKQILQRAAEKDHRHKFRCEPEDKDLRDPTYKPVSATCSIGDHNVRVMIDRNRDIQDGTHCYLVPTPSNGTPYSPGVSLTLLQLGYGRYKETSQRADVLSRAEQNAKNCGCGWWSIDENSDGRDPNKCNDGIQQIKNPHF